MISRMILNEAETIPNCNRLEPEVIWEEKDGVMIPYARCKNCKAKLQDTDRVAIHTIAEALKDRKKQK